MIERYNYRHRPEPQPRPAPPPQDAYGLGGYAPAEYASPEYAPADYVPAQYAQPQYAPAQYQDEPVQYAYPPAEYPDPAEVAVEKKTKGAAHWVAFVLACAVIGAAIGLVIVGFMKFVNGPVTAKATTDPLEKAREAAVPTPSTNLLQGKQITLRYPSSYDAVGDQHEKNGYDAFVISSNSSIQRTIAVSVVNLSSNRLDDDSGYKYRSIHSDLYSAKQMKIGPETAVIMTKTDNTEVTLFWPHKGKDLNLSLTTANPKDNLLGTLNQIIPTIQWLQ